MLHASTQAEPRSGLGLNELLGGEQQLLITYVDRMNLFTISH